LFFNLIIFGKQIGIPLFEVNYIDDLSASAATVVIATAATASAAVIARIVCGSGNIRAYSGNKFRFLRWSKDIHWEVKVVKKLTWAKC